MTGKYFTATIPMKTSGSSDSSSFMVSSKENLLSVLSQVQHSLSYWNDTRFVHVGQGWLHCLLLYIKCKSKRVKMPNNPCLQGQRPCTTTSLKKCKILMISSFSQQICRMLFELQQARGAEGGEVESLEVLILYFTFTPLHYSRLGSGRKVENQ